MLLTASHPSDAFISPSSHCSYTDSLSVSAESLPSVDLTEIARSSNTAELCRLCQLVIGITIQSDRTKEDHIAAMQTLSQEDQHCLMVAIEDIISLPQRSVDSDGSGPLARPSDSGRQHAQTIRHFARLTQEKDDLQKLYAGLAEELHSLQSSHEDLERERNELSAELDSLRQAAEQRDADTSIDIVLKAQVESLKGQLRKSEDDLSEMEREVERLSRVEQDLSKKVSGRVDQIFASPSPLHGISMRMSTQVCGLTLG